MNRRMIGCILIACLALAPAAWAQGNAPKGQGGKAGKAPQQAAGKAGQPAAAKTPAENYTIGQAVSDKAQLNTIAFSGVAFLTGDFGAATFLPPGKAADYFGFQYMRDIDKAEGGHNMMFLTNIANNTWSILTEAQRRRLGALALSHAPLYRQLAEKRFPLIKAFYAQLEAKGTRFLSRDAVSAWVADIFAIDGRLSLERAQAYGAIIRELDAGQKAALARLAFGDSATWPAIADPFDKRSMTHEQHVLAMTYASELFSWYAGSPEANVYFCPERHGTYFGGFYMKDFPAVGNNDYFIPTSLTGDSGTAFLALLDEAQRSLLTSIVEDQRADLERIVAIRRAVDAELRACVQGGGANQELVLSLSREYGTLDGRLSWLYAERFARVAASLSDAQKAALVKIRNQPEMPAGAFLYADPVALPAVEVPASWWSAVR